MPVHKQSSFAAATFATIAFAIATGFASAQDEKNRDEPETRKSGYLGLSVDFVPPAVRAQTTLEDGFGLSLVFVVPGGPGHNAGLQVYDILSTFDDQRLTHPSTLRTLASSKAPGDVVRLTILRRGKAQVIPVTVGDVRDAPANLLTKSEDSHGPILDTLVELFRRGAANGGNGPQLRESPDGDLKLEWKDSINGLLTDLRKQRSNEGIRLKTLDVNLRADVSTPELNITIVSQGKEGTSWISARYKNGDTMYEGPLNKKTPPQLVEIIENTPSLHEFAKLLGNHKQDAPQRP